MRLFWFLTSGFCSSGSATGSAWPVRNTTGESTPASRSARSSAGPSISGMRQSSTQASAPWPSPTQARAGAAAGKSFTRKPASSRLAASSPRKVASSSTSTIM